MFTEDSYAYYLDKDIENPNRIDFDIKDGKVELVPAKGIEEMYVPNRGLISQNSEKNAKELEAKAAGLNATPENTGFGSKIKSYLSNVDWSQASSAVVNTMGLRPEEKYNKDGISLSTGMEKSKSQGYEAAKDTVGQIIPVAGIFRGVEKAGKAIGQSFGDDSGDFAQGFLDPFSNVMREDTNWGEKILSVLDPVIAGQITNKKNDKLRYEAIQDQVRDFDLRRKEDRMKKYEDEQARNKLKGTENTISKQMKFNTNIY